MQLLLAKEVICYAGMIGCASLQKSMPIWQQSVLKAIPRGFFEPHDLPSDEMFDEMFARGERVLAKAAEETLKAAQGRVLTF